MSARFDIVQTSRGTQYVQSSNTKRLQEQLLSMYHDAQPYMQTYHNIPPLFIDPESDIIYEHVHHGVLA
jgi:hypothetical protein